MDKEYSMDDTLAVWCEENLANMIKYALKDFPFHIFVCENSDDVCACPYFLLISDGSLFTRNDRGIDLWSCFLMRYSGKGKKCPRCKSYIYCVEDAEKNYDLSEPKYPDPVILLNSHKVERDVDGMFAIIPPFPASEEPKMFFVSWLRKEAFKWHIKVGEWRKQYNFHLMHRESKKPWTKGTAAVKAKEIWTPRNIKLDVEYPEFEDD